MRTHPQLTAKLLASIAPRKRAILKLRTGCSPLSQEELLCIQPKKRPDAAVVKARSLREVGDLLGVSKERIRQLENRALTMLGIDPEQ